MKDINSTLASHNVPTDAKFFRQIFGGIALGINRITDDSRDELLKKLRNRDADFEQFTKAQMFQIALPIAFELGGQHQLDANDMYAQMRPIFVDLFADELGVEPTDSQE